MKSLDALFRSFFGKRTNGHKPTMQMSQTTQRRAHLAITAISRNRGIARSLSDNIKEEILAMPHLHLGFYPPQTPYTRPRCAQVTISAQTREPACGSLSRDPPLPTIQVRGRSAVFLWCSAASTCPGFPHWSKKTETTATTRFSILWHENEVHHPRVFPKSLQHRTVAQPWEVQVRLVKALNP